MMSSRKNPIIVEFRHGAWSIAKTVEEKRKAAHYYLEYLKGDVYDWRGHKPEVHEHARKVFARLANATSTR